MIAIINVSEERGVAYSRRGVQHYRVQLNQIPLTEFIHKAEDGMAKCLELSAKALEGVDIDEIVDNHQLKGLIKQAIDKFPKGWRG
jgi:hypothetical protein